MTSQEPYTQHLSDPDFPDTEVILVEQPAPVFVDSTGRRRRVLRRFSYAFGAFCMVYGGLISLSLAGGPVSPDAVIPFPGLIAGTTDRAGEAAPTQPAPSAVTAPRAVLVNEATARRTAGLPPRAATGNRPAAPATTSAPARATAVRPPAATTADPPAAAGARTTEATTTTRPTPVPSPATISVPNAPVPNTPVPDPPPPTAAPNPGGTGGGSPSGGDPGSTPTRADPGAPR